MIGATLRHTANPTMLTAGYKSNVIPGEAEAVVDARFLPADSSRTSSSSSRHCWNRGSPWCRR